MLIVRDDTVDRRLAPLVPVSRMVSRQVLDLSALRSARIDHAA
jgi:hypothetical protein